MRKGRNRKKRMNRRQKEWMKTLVDEMEEAGGSGSGNEEQRVEVEEEEETEEEEDEKEM